MPPIDLDVADLAPSHPALTPYDEQHAITYMRLLDADAEGADWREVARIVLHIDPEREPDPGAAGLRQPSCPRQVGGTGKQESGRPSSVIVHSTAITPQ